MIIYAAKLHKKRIFLGLFAFLLLCGAFAVYAGSHNFWASQSVSATVSTQRVKNNEARIAYLEDLGWSVTPTAVAVEELRIPTSFDDLGEYMAIQADQGFQLGDYAGKKVKRYTYGIENYPDASQNIMASILVYKNKVIGGEIFSADSGQILHGLTLP